MKYSEDMKAYPSGNARARVDLLHRFERAHLRKKWTTGRGDPVAHWVAEILGGQGGVSQ